MVEDDADLLFLRLQLGQCLAALLDALPQLDIQLAQLAGREVLGGGVMPRGEQQVTRLQQGLPGQPAP
ncbi:hypothetical protein D3C78_1194280 [compost metagenome]